MNMIAFYLHAVEQCVKFGRNISCFSRAPNSQAVDRTFCCCCCPVSPDKHFGGHQVYVTVFIATLHYMQLCFDKFVSKGERNACVTSCFFVFVYLFFAIVVLFCFKLPSYTSSHVSSSENIFPFPEGGCCDIHRSESNRESLTLSRCAKNRNNLFF